MVDRILNILRTGIMSNTSEVLIIVEGTAEVRMEAFLSEDIVL